VMKQLLSLLFYEWHQRCYQRDILSHEHRAAQVLEHYVGRAEWSRINYTYNRMASRCRLLCSLKVFRKYPGQEGQGWSQAGGFAAA
jgi:hypothetical protein